MDWRTPGYIVLAETNREKILMRAWRRARKFEEDIRTSTDRLILKACLKGEGKEHRREKELQGKRRIFKAKWL